MSAFSTSVPPSWSGIMGTSTDNTAYSAYGLDDDRGTHVPKCFSISPFPAIKCKVHPGVIFTILDAFVRRQEDQAYVIGTLMGIVNEGNVVDITDCFVDRHSLTDNGLLQIVKDHHESMYELKQKVNAKEDVVGWFCTGNAMTELTCAIHGWFKSFPSVSKFIQQLPLIEPIHLVVDTTLKNNKMSIKAFLQVPVNLVKDACFMFSEIPMEIHTTPAEKAGMSMLLKSGFAQDGNRGYYSKYMYGSHSTASSALANSSGGIPRTPSALMDEELSLAPPVRDGFLASLDKLSELLDKCSSYVNDILSDPSKKPSSNANEIGRRMMLSLRSECLIDKSTFESLCQSSLQDTLMVAYLSSLARLQFAIAEKLNTSFF